MGTPICTLLGAMTLQTRSRLLAAGKSQCLTVLAPSQELAYVAQSPTKPVGFQRLATTTTNTAHCWQHRYPRRAAPAWPLHLLPNRSGLCIMAISRPVLRKQALQPHCSTCYGRGSLTSLSHPTAAAVEPYIHQHAAFIRTTSPNQRSL